MNEPSCDPRHKKTEGIKIWELHRPPTAAAETKAQQEKKENHGERVEMLGTKNLEYELARQFM